MNYKLRTTLNFGLRTRNCKPFILCCITFILCSLCSFSQVTTAIDTTTIRIGEQIKYQIKVEADSTALVVFPEGQTFMPLEAVEALAIDTIKRTKKQRLSRTYKLTQFDSGVYTIPRQKIIIDNNTFFTDSLKVEVNTIKVDTTKQKLYDIKPIIDVKKRGSNWWIWLISILLILALVVFLLYWFIWRVKPLTEEEEMALLPPYDRAKLALKKLDESQYLMRSEVKGYYSELTFIIRKYLDEKVYDHALESTTDELINRLNLLKDGNQIDLSKDTIKNLESILKRADLVKFAKSSPDTVLAEMDKQTIDKELDHVKEGLPEPTEEEKLLDIKYREAQERKKKRRKIGLTLGVSLALISITFISFGVTYGFGYVKDTIIGHKSKILLEGDWVKSAYGFPPIWIETPKVLKRENVEVPEEQKKQIKVNVFRHLAAKAVIDIQVSTTEFNITDENGKPKQFSEEDINQDLLEASENYIKILENDGASNITVKSEQFTTPNAAEGLKTYGTFESNGNEKGHLSHYTILLFRAQNVRQQVVLRWQDDDIYADEIIKRIIDSIELNPQKKD